MNCVYIKVSILTAVFMEIKTSELKLRRPVVCPEREVRTTKLRGDFVSRNIYFSKDSSESPMTDDRC